MTLLYWYIGKTISTTLLKSKRADYGESIVATLSQQLTLSYGKEFTKSSLHRMITFFKTFESEEKIATASQQLSWSHFIELIVIGDELKRDFYLELCKQVHWSVRTLIQRISSMLFERTALSKKPDDLIRHELEILKSEGPVTPDLVF